MQDAGIAGGAQSESLRVLGVASAGSSGAEAEELQVHSVLPVGVRRCVHPSGFAR